MPEQQSLISSGSLPNHPGVYLIRHRGSSKLYVGSAISLLRRHGEHQRMLRRSGHENDHLQKAWARYGANDFEFVVLLICAAEHILFYEQRALDRYRAAIGWRRLYNHNVNASNRLGSKDSEETRAKKSAKLRGNTRTLGHKLSDDHKAKISVATTRRNLGHKVSDETKAKIGNANRGRIASAETRAKISAAGKGRVFSAEHRARLKGKPSPMLGKHHSVETKTKLSLAGKGRVVSQETRQRISEGVRASIPRRAKKTHCKNGHLLPAEPNEKAGKGLMMRRCQICKRASEKARTIRRKIQRQIEKGMS